MSHSDLFNKCCCCYIIYHDSFNILFYYINQCNIIWYIIALDKIRFKKVIHLKRYDIVSKYLYNIIWYCRIRYFKLFLTYVESYDITFYNMILSNMIFFSQNVISYDMMLLCTIWYNRIIYRLIHHTWYNIICYNILKWNVWQRIVIKF